MPRCTVLGRADTRTELELESMILAKRKQALSIFLLIQLHFLSSNIISKEDVKSGGAGYSITDGVLTLSFTAHAEVQESFIKLGCWKLRVLRTK